MVNPSIIIGDKISAFTNKEFHEYFKKVNIKRATITVGLSFANNSLKCQRMWFEHVTKDQQAINSIHQRSIKKTPYELLFDTKMKHKEDLWIIDLLNSTIKEQFMKDREDLCKEVKKNIIKIQQENQKQYNLWRWNPTIGDLVASIRQLKKPVV